MKRHTFASFERHSQSRSPSSNVNVFQTLVFARALSYTSSCLLFDIAAEFSQFRRCSMLLGRSVFGSRFATARDPFRESAFQVVDQARLQNRRISRFFHVGPCLYGSRLVSFPFLRPLANSPAVRWVCVDTVGPVRKWQCVIAQWHLNVNCPLAVLNLCKIWLNCFFSFSSDSFINNFF